MKTTSKIFTKRFRVYGMILNLNLSLNDHFLHLLLLFRLHRLKIIAQELCPEYLRPAHTTQARRRKAATATPSPQHPHDPACWLGGGDIHIPRTKRSPYLTVVRPEIRRLRPRNCNAQQTASVCTAYDAAEDAKSWCLNSGDFLIYSG